jgi:hypothetical protein
MDPFGIAIFCDDVRQEAGGKISLIGCYGTDMQFADVTFPITIAKIGIYMVARLPVDRATPPIQLLVYLPGDSDDAPTTKFDFPLPPEMQTPWADGKDPMWPAAQMSDVDRAHMLRHHLVISPAVLKEEGFIRVRMMYGEQRVRLGVLKVHVAKGLSTTPAAPPPARLPA